MSNQLKMWWEDPDKVERLAYYLVNNEKLTTASDLLDLQKKPEAYQKEFDEMMRKATLALAVKRPQTSEFFDERFYPINGDHYESITTILWAYPSPWLTTFVGNVGNVEAELRKAIGGERGSKVHDALQKNNIQAREYYTDEEWLCLIHAKQFHEKYNPELILNEQWCWSVKKHYAGRFDRIVRINGKATLIDWKTGYVGREAWLQLAAEKCAIEEMMNIVIESWGIVALNNRTEAGWKYYPIEERADVKEIRKEYASVQNDGKDISEQMAVRDVYEQDIFIFDNLHQVWKDCFRNVKPKRYPVFPVPGELDLSIPIFDTDKVIEEQEAKTIENNSGQEIPSAPTLFNTQGTLDQSVVAKSIPHESVLEELLNEMDNFDSSRENLTNWYEAGKVQERIEMLSTKDLKEFMYAFDMKINMFQTPEEPTPTKPKRGKK